MPQEGFEPTISARELPQTNGFDHAVIGIGIAAYMSINA
jgi:hypothetical protein